MFEGLFQPMHLLVLLFLFAGIPLGIYVIVRIVRKAWHG